MPEKKCVSCKNMNICSMYRGLADLAGLIISNTESSLTHDTFTRMVETMAYDCKRWTTCIECIT